MAPLKQTSPLLTLPLLTLSGVAAAQTNPSQPNVILILADDMGYGGVHCYGGDGIPSPAIDRLAEEGIVCTNFHTNAPVSSPTRVSIMTGCYQQRAGLNHIYSETDPMDGLDPDQFPAFATQLQAAGYRTGIMGKWHLGQDLRYNPLNHGFDEWHGYVMGNIDFHSHYNTQHRIDWWDGREVKDEPGYVTHLINRYSVEFIRESVEQQKPFFLFVSHNAVHVPMQGPNDPPLRTAEKCPYRHDKHMAPAEYQRIYRDMVQAMDEGVGQIVEALREAGVEDNTLIIFTSDNGGASTAAEKYPSTGGYLRGAKGTLFEGGLRVPAIFHYPAGWGHRISPEPMMTMDLMPTILEFCGVENNRPIDGVSALSMLTDGRPLPQRKVFYGYTGWMAMTEGYWKMVGRKDGTYYLFNLFNDPQEEHDLSALYPERVERMRAEFEEWWAQTTKGTRLEGKNAFNASWR